jgi:molybdenum cofactor biosynthesis protein A
MDSSSISNILIDSFGRKHNYLRISLTERCNLRCFYCMPEEGVVLRDRAEFMTSEEVVYLAGLFVKLGVEKIRLTGGEPLIKKDIANVMTQLGSLPIDLGLTTNGLLVDRHIETFKTAGIKNINLSLDTLQEDRFNKITRRNSFQQVMKNIHLLFSMGFKVKVNVVLMRGENEDEIIDFVEWSKNLPVNIRFIEFMPFSGNNWNTNKKIPHDEVVQTVIQHFGADKLIKIKDQKNDTAVNYQIKGFQGSFGLISTVTQPFCSSCNRIRLTADGKLKNCLFSDNELDLLTPLRAGEDILQLIEKAIIEKKGERGGITDFDSFSAHNNNRSMITIGG